MKVRQKDLKKGQIVKLKLGSTTRVAIVDSINQDSKICVCLRVRYVDTNKVELLFGDSQTLVEIVGRESEN